MSMKVVPFSAAQIAAVLDTFPTPFHLYDERGIRAQVRALQAAFAWCPGFREYFAVKATPTPAIIRVVAEEGCGVDCSSLAELVLAERVGLRGDDIFFSSNNTPADEFAKARELGAIINLDDLGHIATLHQHGGVPATLSLRYNPGSLREGNAIIGNPIEAKFGVTRDQLFAGYRTLRDLGVTRFGLHTMVVSNELRVDALVETARMLFELAAELSAHLSISFAFLNLGGGIGIPYRPEQQPVDLHAFAAGVRDAYATHIVANGLAPLPIWMECGRLITGPHGVLVTRVRHLKETYKRYVGVDATMADLMRPGMYGAYHHITVAGKEHQPLTYSYDVTGSLCENNDKFAIDRMLPEVAVGDVLLIHDTGAHGRAMGFNYNGKLRCGELLLQEDSSVRQIRRPETLADYFATVDGL